EAATVQGAPHPRGGERRRRSGARIHARSGGGDSLASAHRGVGLLLRPRRDGARRDAQSARPPRDRRRPIRDRNAADRAPRLESRQETVPLPADPGRGQVRLRESRLDAADVGRAPSTLATPRQDPVAWSCGACSGGVQRSGQALSSHKPSSTRKRNRRSAPAKASSSGPSQITCASPVRESVSPEPKSTKSRPARGLSWRLPNVLKKKLPMKSGQVSTERPASS